MSNAREKLKKYTTYEIKYNCVRQSKSERREGSDSLLKWLVRPSVSASRGGV